MRAKEGYENLPDNFKVLDATYWEGKTAQELYCEICQCTFNKFSST